MKDYEQLYYDSQYEIKNLKYQIELLEQQIELYKLFQKDNNIKQIIIKDLSKYLMKGNKKYERSQSKESEASE